MTAGRWVRLDARASGRSGVKNETAHGPESKMMYEAECDADKMLHYFCKWAPPHIQDLIALYAHPIHPCTNDIVRFRWMVAHFVDRQDEDWSGLEFRQYEHWNTRMYHNGLEPCPEWLDDIVHSITNYTTRTKALFLLAEQRYTFRDSHFSDYVRQRLATSDMYSTQTLVELMAILSRR